MLAVESISVEEELLDASSMTMEHASFSGAPEKVAFEHPDGQASSKYPVRWIQP